MATRHWLKISVGIISGLVVCFWLLLLFLFFVLKFAPLSYSTQMQFISLGAIRRLQHPYLSFFANPLSTIFPSYKLTLSSPDITKIYLFRDRNIIGEYMYIGAGTVSAFNWDAEKPSVDINFYSGKKEHFEFLGQEANPEKNSIRVNSVVLVYWLTSIPPQQYIDSKLEAKQSTSKSPVIAKLRLISNPKKSD